MADADRYPPVHERRRFEAALDKLGLMVLPILVGEGIRLTPSLSTDTELTLESEHALPGGWVKIVSVCDET